MLDHRIVSASIMALAIGIASPAVAQVGTQADANHPANATTGAPSTGSSTGLGTESAPNLTATGGTHLGEIIVTAQRKSENLQKVPVSVTPVSGAELKNRNINDLTQLTVAAPCFQTGMDNSFSIRGVGSAIFLANIDSSVGVAVDEVSLGVPLFMSNGILDDTAQIEVLNGPQGLLFGRNADAGLLNIITNRPVLNKFEGYLSQEFDYRDTVPGSGFGTVTRGTVNVPISDTMAFRFNGLYSYQDPIVKHIGPSDPGLQDNQRRLAGRAKWLWKPDDKFTVYVIGDYSRERGIGAIFDRSYRSLGATSVNTAAVAADGITPGPDNFLFASDAPSYRSVDTYGVSANIAYKVNDWLTISDVAAWRSFKLNLQLDTDFTSGNSIDTNRTFNKYNQYSNELRASFNPGRLSGQVGFYYFNTALNGAYNLYVDAYTPIPAGFDALLGQDGVYRQRSNSYAGFGQMTYKLFDRFRLIAGGRVTDDHLRIAETQNTATYVVPGLFGPTYATPQRFRTSNTDFSYKAGAQYDVTPAIMIYGTYGKGYKGPSFNLSITNSSPDPVINPEHSRAIEAGVKSTLFDRKLRLNASLFSTKFTNFQVQSSDGVAFTTQSVADVRSKGIEFSANAKPIEGLSLNAGGTVLSSKFTNYPGAPCYAGQADNGCVAAMTGDSFNARGLRTPLAPKFTSTVQAIYELPVGRSAHAFVQAAWYHRSPVNFEFNGNPGTRFGNVNTLGLSAGFRPTNNLEFTIFCKNCTNQIVPSVLIADIFDSNALNSNTIVNSFNYDSVRTIGVTASAHF